MDIRKVKKLIELLEESGVSEIEICEGEESVRISRHSAAAQTVVQVPNNMSAPMPIATPSDSTAEETAETVSSEARENNGYIVTSPMVGIFYTAPAPGEPAFVNVGQSVNKGDVICVLEAMKIMNQIESDISGTVTQIHVSNGEAVEYGQPLFTIQE